MRHACFSCCHSVWRPIKRGRWTGNPALGLERVRHEAKTRERRALTADELGRLLGTAPADRALLYRTAATTGLRRGELAALTWGDVDLDDATVTVCHSRTKDLAGVCRGADILVAAVGRPDMIKGDWIKPGAVVIDVGINRIEVDNNGEKKFKLTGDVDFAEASQVAAAITPVPGGVGPMTIALLMANTLRAAKMAAGVKD